MLDMLQKIVSVLMSLLMTFLGSSGIVKKQYDTYANIAYGTSEQQMMDIYVPANAQLQTANAAVIYLHGGFFKDGSKADLVNSCETIANKGYIAVAMDYTLLNDKIKSYSVFTMLEDLNSAILRLQEFSRENGLNIKKIALAGDSAGGYLAMMYAYGMGYRTAIDLAFIAVRVAPSDFSYDQWKSIQSDADYVAMINQFSGLGSLTQSDLTSNPTKVQEAANLISPVHYITKNTALPTLFAYAQKDNVVPYSNRTSMKDALDAAGAKYNYVDYSNAGHDLTSNWMTGLLQTADFSSLLSNYCSTYFSFS